METNEGLKMQLISHLISAQWSVHASIGLIRRGMTAAIWWKGAWVDTGVFAHFGQDRQLLTLPVKMPNFLGRPAHCLVNTTVDYDIRPLLIAPSSLNMLKSIPNTSERDVV